MKRQGTLASVTCHKDFPQAQFRDNSGLIFHLSPEKPLKCTPLSPLLVERKVKERKYLKVAIFVYFHFFMK